MFGRQINHVVGEPEGDFIEWKIGEFDFLGEHDAPVVPSSQVSVPEWSGRTELPDRKLL